MADECTHLDTVARRRAVEHRLRGLPAHRRSLGAPAAVHGVRPRRVLRQLAEPARAPRTTHATEHPIIRSYEPGEDWWYCYPDDLMFMVDGAPPAPSHP